MDKEKALFRFLARLPAGFLLLFWAGIVLAAVRYVVGYLVPLQQRHVVDEALATGVVLGPQLSLYAVLLAIVVALLYLEYVGFRRLRVGLRSHLFQQCVVQIMALPRTAISKRGTGYYSGILANLTSSLSSLIHPSVFGFVFGAIETVLVNIVIVRWNPELFYVLLPAYALVAANAYVFQRARNKHLSAHQEASASLSAATEDLISNVFTVRVFHGAAAYTRPLWENLDATNLQYSLFQRALERNRTAFQILKWTSFVLMIVLSLRRVVAGTLTVGQLSALLVYFERVLAPFDGYVTFMNSLTEYGSWVERWEGAFADEIEERAAAEPYFSRFSMLELSSVSIPTQRATSRVDLAIDRRIGLVGLSGDGKTSILKVLYRELEPAAGSVLVNGTVPAARIPLLYYLDRMAIVGQDAEVFNSDLHTNLLVGKSVVADGHVGQKRSVIAKTLSDLMAGVRPRYWDLPDFLQTAVTTFGIVDEHWDIPAGWWRRFVSYVHEKPDEATDRVFGMACVAESTIESTISVLGLDGLRNRSLGQRGEFVSGGERRRIAFARFLMKPDYDYFVLDEPFEALDAVTEASLLRTVATAISRKPGVVISHKFHVIEALCDYFVVIREGTIAERGTLEELVRKGGEYARLRRAYFEAVAEDQRAGAHDVGPA